MRNTNPDCQFFAWDDFGKQDFEDVASVFEMDSAGAAGSWYVGWANCDPEAAEILRDYYTTPAFLPTEKGPSRWDWIFIGTPGYGAPFHIDSVKLPSWQAQVGI